MFTYIFQKIFITFQYFLKYYWKWNICISGAKGSIFHNILKKTLRFKGVQRRLCGVKGYTEAPDMWKHL